MSFEEFINSIFFHLLVVCYKHCIMMYNFAIRFIVVYFTKQSKIIEAINVF